MRPDDSQTVWYHQQAREYPPRTLEFVNWLVFFFISIREHGVQDELFGFVFYSRTRLDLDFDWTSSCSSFFYSEVVKEYLLYYRCGWLRWSLLLVFYFALCFCETMSYGHEDEKLLIEIRGDLGVNRWILSPSFSYHRCSSIWVQGLIQAITLKVQLALYLWQSRSWNLTNLKVKTQQSQI